MNAHRHNRTQARMRFGLFACLFALGCAATQEGAVDPGVRFVPLAKDASGPTASVSSASTPVVSAAASAPSFAAGAAAAPSATLGTSAVAPPPAVALASTSPGSVAPLAGPTAEDEEEGGPIDFEESGSLSLAQRAVLKVVGRCFVRALERGDESNGALWVQLSVAADGRVESALLADGFSPYVKTCASAKLKALSFPESPEELRTYRFPINEIATESREPEN